MCLDLCCWLDLISLLLLCCRPSLRPIQHQWEGIDRLRRVCDWHVHCVQVNIFIWLNICLYMHFISIVLCRRGTMDDKIHFLFSMYDVSHDKSVSKQELATLLNQGTLNQYTPLSLSHVILCLCLYLYLYLSLYLCSAQGGAGCPSFSHQ